MCPTLPPKDFPSVAIGTVPMFMVERQRRGGGSSNFDWVAWVTELTVFLFLLCTEFWVFFKM